MVKAGLAVFLALWTPVQAAEPAFDALSHLLREYAGPVDAVAAEAAPEDGAPPGERLAKVSADLALMAEGLETFRASGPGAIPGDFAPELASHFQDRDAALAAVYRTLAVTDYTWAMRFDGGDCAPRERRSALLADPDGLFAGPDGSVSPWLARLLGPASAGKSSAEALDRASRRGSLSARDYELLRVKAAKIAEALRSERAEGAERARLYCRRAEIHESLASAHRAAGAPIAAGLATAGRASDSVFLMVWSSGPATARAVGAGVLLDTPAGPKAFTDARLSPREGWTLSAVVRGRDGRLGARHPFKAESVDAAAGILVGTVPGASVPALKATAHPAELADLVRSIGHVGAAGAWSMAQGLVTETGGTTFASDAVLGPDMLGSPLLNEEGELVGLVVLSPSGSPVAVRVDRLLQAAQAAPAPGEVEFVAARHSGSASLLTTAMPITGALTGAGEGAVEAGLPSSMGGVNWEGGGGVGNWRPRSSAGPPRGYSSRSSGSSSSYSSGSSPGAEIGAELGKALAPLVEALIFKGIPALFRGVGSLFKSKPKAPIVKAKASEKPRPVATERKPDPKYEVRIVPERAQVEEGQPVRFIATVTANRPEMPLGNIVIKFNVRGAEEVSGVTDSSGRIVLTVDPPVSVAAHKALEAEARRHDLLISASREQSVGACKTVFKVAAGLAVVTIGAASLAGGPPVAIVGGQACAAILGGTATAAVATCAVIFATDRVIDPKHPGSEMPVTLRSAANENVIRAADSSQNDLDSEAVNVGLNVGESASPPDPDDDDSWRKINKRVKVSDDQRIRINRVLDKIQKGDKLDFPRRDGTIYRNRGPGRLPLKADPEYYREYTVSRADGSRGLERVILGKGGEIYFTPDHYETFILFH